jgi:FKBP-type peptidyl-prolyl cis-trans isomerase
MKKLLVGVLCAALTACAAKSDPKAAVEVAREIVGVTHGPAAQKAEQAFLAANAARPGVRVSASGLQYEVLREGAGRSPGPDSSVLVHYEGWLVDGRKFDSSRDRSQPALFALPDVIDGWREALPMMKVGSQYKLFVPSRLAFGPLGTTQGVIGPYAPLVFEVELLGVEN